jgi:hypothetical protein
VHLGAVRQHPLPALGIAAGGDDAVAAGAHAVGDRQPDRPGRTGDEYSHIRSCSDGWLLKA